MVIEDHFSGTIKNVAVDLKTIFYWHMRGPIYSMVVSIERKCDKRVQSCNSSSRTRVRML